MGASHVSDDVVVVAQEGVRVPSGEQERVVCSDATLAALLGWVDSGTTIFVVATIRLGADGPACGWADPFRGLSRGGVFRVGVC